MRVLKVSTVYPLMVFVTSSSDHITGATGATLTITASAAGGAFAAITPAVTELGNGWYSLALTTAHTATLGDLAIHANASGADPTDLICQVVAYDSQATSLGLSLVKTTNITGFNDLAATAIVSGGAITTSGGAAAANITQINGGAATAVGSVPVNLSQALNAPRTLDTVPDASLTLNDALHAAIAGAAGQESVVGTAFTVATPAGTTLRNLTLNSATAPTSRV